MEGTTSVRSVPPKRLENQDLSAAKQNLQGEVKTDASEPTKLAPPWARAQGYQQASLEVLAEVRRLRREVAQIRQLPALEEDLKIAALSRGELRQWIAERLREDIGLEQIRLFGRIQQSLGILPPGVDGEQALLNLYESAVLGLYDPKSEVLFIGDFLSGPLRSTVLAHEVSHRIQDEHFDLEALHGKPEGNNDFEMAKSMLIEGDATATYYAWEQKLHGIEGISLQELSSLADQNLEHQVQQSPYPILSRILQIPYTEGTRSIVALARERGWKHVDALFEDPPQTTEQLLHRHKFERKEKAISITINPDPLLASFPDHEVLWEDNLGEAHLLAMLADIAPASEARRAAAGWGGDRYIVLDRKDAFRSSKNENQAGPPMVIGLIAWDTLRDAKQFAGYFEQYLKRHKGSNYLLERKGSRILYACEMERRSEATVKLTQQAWKAFKIRRSRRSGR